MSQQPHAARRTGASSPRTDRIVAAPRAEPRARSGAVAGNELLTSATASVLTVLLVALGVTIVHMRGLVSVHMLLGLALIPPVALKLASTGYRFARYYAGSRGYRAKGPPRPALRLLAPVLVAATVVVFASGVLLLAAGHKTAMLLEIHKVAFIVWGVVFAIHFLAYVPRVLRTLLDAWRAPRAARVPGGAMRRMLVAASLGTGLALAVALLPTIDVWRA